MLSYDTIHTSDSVHRLRQENIFTHCDMLWESERLDSTRDIPDGGHDGVLLFSHLRE